MLQYNHEIIQKYYLQVTYFQQCIRDKVERYLDFFIESAKNKLVGLMSQS